jgi:hypothetical protein
MMAITTSSSTNVNAAHLHLLTTGNSMRVNPPSRVNALAGFSRAGPFPEIGFLIQQKYWT